MYGITVHFSFATATERAPTSKWQSWFGAPQVSRFSLVSSPMSLLLLSRTGTHVGCLVLVCCAYSIDTLLFNPCIDTELIFLKKIG